MWDWLCNWAIGSDTKSVEIHDSSTDTKGIAVEVSDAETVAGNWRKGNL
jgi:hypothetical protein